MPSFPDSIFLFVLALLLFGPKRLPVLARELGKWVGEFRRASNEFKMQMEEELRLSEQAERNKQIAAIAAAAPTAPAITAPEEPETAARAELPAGAAEDADSAGTGWEESSAEAAEAVRDGERSADLDPPWALQQREMEAAEKAADPLPIAVSGDLKIMPPRTGLPVAQQAAAPMDAGRFDLGLGEAGIQEAGTGEGDPAEALGRMPSASASPEGGAGTRSTPPQTDGGTATDLTTPAAERALHGD